MSHWTTSGKSRLNAKQSRSFGPRAQQRANVMVPSSSMMMPRLSSPPPAVGKRRGGGGRKPTAATTGATSRSTSLNPIVRRGLTVKIANARHPRMLSAQAMQLTAPPSGPRRRIRDQHSSSVLQQQYQYHAHHQQYSPAPHAQQQHYSSPVPQRHLPPQQQPHQNDEPSSSHPPYYEDHHQSLWNAASSSNNHNSSHLLVREGYHQQHQQQQNATAGLDDDFAVDLDPSNSDMLLEEEEQLQSHHVDSYNNNNHNYYREEGQEGLWDSLVQLQHSDNQHDLSGGEDMMFEREEGGGGPSPPPQPSPLFHQHPHPIGGSAFNASMSPQPHHAALGRNGGIARFQSQRTNQSIEYDSSPADHYHSFPMPMESNQHNSNRDCGQGISRFQSPAPSSAAVHHHSSGYSAAHPNDHGGHFHHDEPNPQHQQQEEWSAHHQQADVDIEPQEHSSNNRSRKRQRTIPREVIPRPCLQRQVSDISQSCATTTGHFSVEMGSSRGRRNKHRTDTGNTTSGPLGKTAVAPAWDSENIPPPNTVDAGGVSSRFNRNWTGGEPVIHDGTGHSGDMMDLKASTEKRTTNNSSRVARFEQEESPDAFPPRSVRLFHDGVRCDIHGRPLHLPSL